ncbi:MAG: redoxin domain-containing protein [Lawsonibacter sp.]|nr:redoxin domain-containing protein [Lawsonibacter sp.]
MPIICAEEQFPNLVFQTYRGETKSVADVVRTKRHTVFWVMRFIGCRFCQYDIEMLEEEYCKFTDMDTQVFVVLQSSAASINGLKGQLQVPFDVICDTNHTFYKELDIRATATKEDRMPKTEEGLAKLMAKQADVRTKDYQRQTGEGEAQQLPALFIVGPDCKVEYAHYAVNSIDIPEMDELLRLISE